MADIRTLKLNLLADTDQFKRGLSGASGATKTFAGQVGHYTRRVAQSFALAGAAAGAFALKVGVDSVKAAIEDERSQRLLAKQLKNTMHATDAQVASVEEYINKTQLAYGIQDDKLRPALARLVRSTKDATQAQKYLNLAMDISSATGKPLETVTAALGKAIDGNSTALGRLGLGIDSNILKSKDMDKIYAELRKQFGGFAEQEASTLDGKMRRLGVSVDELKESLGSRLIPVLTDEVFPNIQQFIAVLSGNGTGTSATANMNGAIYDSIQNKYYGTNALAESLKNLGTAFNTLYAAIVGPDSTDAQSTLSNTATVINTFAKAISLLAGGIRELKGALSYFNELPAGLRNPFLAPFALFAQAFKPRAMGGPVSGGSPYLVGERGPELFVPSTSGSIVPNNRMGGGTTVININGVVDAESARRSIERLIQQSSRRTGPINWAGAIA